MGYFEYEPNGLRMIHVAIQSGGPDEENRIFFAMTVIGKDYSYVSE